MKGRDKMKIVRRLVVGIAGVAVVALVMEMATPKAARALANLFVTVTNTSANPVPVSGAVTVSGLPAVQIASVSGNVPVTNALDRNNNAIPLVVQNPLSAGNAFDVSGFCNFAGNALSCDAQPYTVPDGKIAVIQSVTGSCSLDSGTGLTSVELSYTAPNGSRVGSFPSVHATQQFTNFASANFGGSLVNYAAGAPIGLAVIDVDFFTSASQSSGRICSIEIAGYLVNQ